MLLPIIDAEEKSKLTYVGKQPFEIIHLLRKNLDMADSMLCFKPSIQMLNLYLDGLKESCYTKDKAKHIDETFDNMMYILSFERELSNEMVRLIGRGDILPVTLRTMCYYHDIAKNYDDSQHGEIAAELIKDDYIITRCLEEDTVTNVILMISNALKYHTHNEYNLDKRETVFDMLLYDADKIRNLDGSPKLQKRITESTYDDGYLKYFYFESSRSLMDIRRHEFILKGEI